MIPFYRKLPGINYAIRIRYCIEINDWMIDVNWKYTEGSGCQPTLRSYGRRD
jgi:hypothetical protein